MSENADDARISFRLTASESARVEKMMAFLEQEPEFQDVKLTQKRFFLAGLRALEQTHGKRIKDRERRARQKAEKEQGL